MDIIYLGDALRYFFYNATINIYQRKVPIDILEFFPSLLKGYTTRVTLMNIIIVYLRTNGSLQTQDHIQYTVTSDDLILKAFNSDISAEFYHFYTPHTIRHSIKNMVDYGFTQLKPNTFDIIKISHENFSSKSFDLNLLIESLFLNYYDNSEMDNYSKSLIDQTNIEAKSLIDQINIETSLSHSLMHCKNSVLEANIAMSEFYNIKSTKGHIELMDIWGYIGPDDPLNIHLRSDEWISLLHSIVIMDPGKVENSLKDVDPRIHNNEAYHLAIDFYHKEIIALISDIIIKKNWEEKMVFESQIELLVGKSDLPLILHRISRQNF